MSVRLLIGDCRERMAELEAGSVDSCVTDPPYHLTNNTGTRSPYPGQYTPIGKPKQPKGGFMGQQWDGGDVAFQPETWAAVWRVLKPGAHLVAFSGTRTYHRMVCAIEDAGFEIRDQLAWIYGSGFPKSHDVSKGIDRMLGGEREVVGTKRAGIARVCRNGGEIVGGICHEELKQSPITAAATPEASEWEGWGTALKPAWEPICLARKPLQGTVAANVLKHGTGAINVAGCRVETDETLSGYHGRPPLQFGGDNHRPFHDRDEHPKSSQSDLGRWPANILHDGSEEVLAGFPDARSDGIYGNERNVSEDMFGTRTGGATFDDSGSAARFFYCSKASSAERGEGNGHPTVKPLDLMQWLCRLVTPKGGTVLDPFAGSGSTLVAADREQFNAIGCELSADYAEIAERRIRACAGMFAEIAA